MEAIATSAQEGPRPLEWRLLALGGISGLWYSLCLAKFGITGSEMSIYSGWTQTFVASSLWGGFAGSMLVMLGSRWSVQAFTVSLVGLLAASANMFVFPDVPANLYAMPTMLGMWLITLAVFYYASRMHAPARAAEEPLDLGQFEVLE